MDLCSLLYCCPEAIMKKLAEIMLHFDWHRSSWQRVDIFWYSLPSRNMLAFSVNIGERKKGKPLQRSYCKVLLFFLVFNSSLFVTRGNSYNLGSICLEQQISHPFIQVIREIHAQRNKLTWSKPFFVLTRPFDFLITWFSNLPWLALSLWRSLS